MKFVSEINVIKKWALRTKVQNKKAEYFAYYLVNALHNIDTQPHHRTFIPATQIIAKEPHTNHSSVPHIITSHPHNPAFGNRNAETTKDSRLLLVLHAGTQSRRPGGSWHNSVDKQAYHPV